MNQGEPAHDDYGLPRVDIEIPDDARELYRDVQAYHRELRALRRRQRSLRWRAPLRRTGIILPLAAGFLILALISGMVLTIFSADPYFSGFGRSGSSNDAAGQTGRGSKTGPATPAGQGSKAGPASPTAPSSPSGSAPLVTAMAAGRLPGTTISVAGKPLALRSLTSTALAMVPANCGCVAAVRQLIAQARQARVSVYLVGLHSSRADLAELATVAGPDAKLATDSRHVLSSAYQPAGLTVLLVDAHGSVKVALRLGPVLDLTAQLQLLRSAG